MRYRNPITHFTSVLDKSQRYQLKYAMQLITFFKQLAEVFLKAPGFILDVWKEVQREPEPDEPPKDYYLYHHKDCGTKYRGCSKDCPKDRYEKTGVWRIKS